MIIITLLGGLGNQMFQYSLGRALSIQLNTDLLLDLSSYRDDPLRSYQLSYFPINLKIASEKELSRVILDEGVKGKLTVMRRLFRKHEPTIKLIYEKNFNFDPKILETSDNSCLFGYWQSEKYFSNISQIIKTDFLFTDTISPKNDQVKKQIKNSSSISIHVRHGDYLSNPATTAHHGICSKEYYNNAIQIVENEILDAEFFIFSDDPDWVKRNITTTRPVTFIDWNSNAPHEDLRLMASCKHHIIANSSFSWWGAWLGANEFQMVIAPEPWLDAKKYNTKDIYVDKWIRIPKT